MRPMPELEIRTEKVADLVPYAGNAKLHPHEQVDQIAASIEEFGNNDPIAVWHNDAGEMEIVEGHGRLLALKKLGIEECPVIYLDHLSDEQRRAYILVHNKLTMNTGFDIAILDAELASIASMDMTDFGFDDSDFSETAFDIDSQYPDGVKGNLAKKFIVPPFSILDTRSAEWIERKRCWRELTGDLSETRDGEYGKIGQGQTNILELINGGTSNFDPVLAEVMYRWFCPDGGTILDPFGGEQTKGVVAGACGYGYAGVEIREDQCEVDRRAVAAYDGIEYVCGDSCEIASLLQGRTFDMCLTSPPYYDLEVYSKDDLSALGTYDEFVDKYSSILAQCYGLLCDGSFMVVKVGEIRDKLTGAFRSFVPDTIRAMCDAGFSYYNELILINSAGSAPIRAQNGMKTRKVCKLHQNVLVFYKGDTRKIQSKFPPIEYYDE